MNIHVGNLPKTAKKEALAGLFKPFGNVVTATIARDKKTGNSRGFGYVEMSTRHEGEEAIANLNDREFEGQKLQVGEAQGSREKSASGSKGRNSSGEQRGGGNFQARAGARNTGSMRRSGRRGA